MNVTAFYALQTYATPSGYLFNYGDTNEVNGTGGMDGMTAAEMPVGGLCGQGGAWQGTLSKGVCLETRVVRSLLL